MLRCYPFENSKTQFLNPYNLSALACVKLDQNFNIPSSSYQLNFISFHVLIILSNLKNSYFIYTSWSHWCFNDIGESYPNCETRSVIQKHSSQGDYGQLEMVIGIPWFFFFIQIDKNKNKFKNVILMLFPSLAQVSSLISVVVSREHFILTNQWIFSLTIRKNFNDDRKKS